MYQAYKFRIYPTSEQKYLLTKAFGCARWYWNWALNLCQEAYSKTKKLPKKSDVKGALPLLKKEYTWLKDGVYSQCLQSVALNLFSAYNNFFSGRAKLPRFKSKKGRQSLRFPQHVKEDLKVSGMVQNKKLAKHISDSGWGMFGTMLKYKAEQEGKVYVEINRFFPSSKTCHCCERKVPDMSLSIRKWICPECNTTHDRDINAAINIKKEGLRIIEEGNLLSACGETVRPSSGLLNSEEASFDEAGSRSCNL